MPMGRGNYGRPFKRRKVHHVLIQIDRKREREGEREREREGERERGREKEKKR